MFFMFARLSVFEAYNQSDVFGKLIFITLFFLSIISWLVIVYKVRLTQKAKKESFQFEKAFEVQKENMLKLKTEHFVIFFNPYVKKTKY